MLGRRPQPRLTRLFVLLAGVTCLTGLLAMHGLAPAHDLMALRPLDGQTAPAAMSAHVEPRAVAGAARVVAGHRTAIGMPSPASVLVADSDMLIAPAGRDVPRAAARDGAGLTNGAMSHGATGACLAILGAGVLVAMIRRSSANWPASATSRTTVAARAGHALHAPHLRCRAPSHLELCVWRT